MATRRARWLRVFPTATLTVVPFVVMGPSALAFFPPIQGGTATVNPSVPPPVVVVPPVPPPPFHPPPVVVPPHHPPVHVVPPPYCVPEPSTLVAGLIGLAAAGIARRRQKGKTDEAV